MNPEPIDDLGDGEIDPQLLEWAEAVADHRSIEWHRTKASTPQLDRSAKAFRLLQEAVQTISAAMSSGVPATPLEAGATWGTLLIAEKIGEGVYGQVYRARDTALEMDVALKLLFKSLPEGNDRDERAFEEARRLAKLRHINVVRVLGAARHAGRVGIWTELIEGRTLEEILDAEGPFSAREASVIGIAVCRALAAVHSANLVHRDLKTSNVMREKGGRIVLMDLGAGGELGTAGQVIGPADRTYGTPLTLAPELLRGERATPASDIYALGVLLFRLVTGRYPLEAENLEELHAKHSVGTSALVLDNRPDLPTAFAEVVEKALRPEPVQRYSSAGAMERALRLALVEPPGGWWPWVSGASAVLIVLGWSAVSSFDRGDRASESSRYIPGGSARSDELRIGVGNPGTSEMGTGRQAVDAGGTLSVDVALLRGERNSLFRLRAGSSISAGDHLSIEVRPSESAYLYVFSEDARGVVSVLFPSSNSEFRNPFPPGETRLLPGLVGGAPRSWLISETAARTDFVVVAARKPWRELEVRLENLPEGRVSGSNPEPGVAGSGISTSDRGPGITGLLQAASAAPDSPHDVQLWRTWVMGKPAERAIPNLSER